MPIIPLNGYHATNSNIIVSNEVLPMGTRQDPSSSGNPVIERPRATPFIYDRQRTRTGIGSESYGSVTGCSLRENLNEDDGIIASNPAIYRVSESISFALNEKEIN
ncbi:hypothetical protein GOBAR_AA04170 [Gossypium barbadense]|uniref:Uncharacterized protein n=1 Tax=Gossypium barbadense TaxID=3634 RepID=A0A2P5YLA4_GOSBA|nr:hypothetical protein GOBAR_AA04170 [Gossypium barbadense]